MSFAAENRIDQIGHVVADLDEAVARRLRIFGIGPWLVFRGVTLEGSYRGKPTQVTIDVGLAWRGDVQIELIAVKSSSPSPYQDENGLPLCGLHHLAWVVEDLDATVEEGCRRGLVEVFRATNPATRVAYMEDPAEPGLYYEFIAGQGMRAMMEAGIRDADGWDGSSPVREIVAQLD